ncbi:glycine betaine ABC transporter substrate-binding protein [Methanolobus mangrovi]|uniref:Glycine betaine ABC transporter substrate-binding protein n=1 Tax=Methanolobus mangrovi TaxID=3072977 RepID=A0AA51UEG6_9EURY|nr:glycine betaine ABC transporter substrate-binding protein [Methanolobus mangrovi]WMW21628.1 glycine betaine ABC transporter substrate-binding protein [Methanolobus mangrovi]
MRKTILITLVVIMTLFASGCTETPADTDVEKGTVVIGSKLFQESYILAHMTALVLEDAGYETDVKQGLGGTFVNYEALKAGQIDVYAEYTGTAYSQILNLSQLDNWDRQVVLDETEAGLLEQDGVMIVSNLGFEDAYAIAVKEDWAAENNITKISDLEPYAAEMTIGTDPEFATREDGLPRIKDVYGFEFNDYKQAVATVMYEAIKSDQVDAISAYTTDTRNEVFELRVLQDDKNALPPYDAILIVTEQFAEENPDAVDAMKKLDGAIDTDTMRQLNYQFDIEQKEPRDIAYQFLVDEGIIEG